MPSPKSRALEPPTTITTVSACSAQDKATSKPSRESPLMRQPGAYNTRSGVLASLLRIPPSTVVTLERGCGEV
ncbi:hypothetical protein D3C76_1637910 [compost metagenome]